MAPELLDEADYDEKVDVYSFGISMLECLLRETMNQSIETEIIATSQYGIFKRPLVPDAIGLPNNFKELILRCIDVDPEMRPSAATIALELKDMAEKTDDSLTLPQTKK